MERVYEVKLLKEFVGRKAEIERLNQIAAQNEAAIIVVHGRRRVGKTELVQQAFIKRNLLKFEGLEGQTAELQRQNFLKELAFYTGNAVIAKLQPRDWVQVLELLAEHVQEGEWTIFLEELQWMANYQTELISALKYVWDNKFRTNPRLLIVLCGSSPSFMVNKVIHSKALYNRSQHEIPLRPFSLSETQTFLGPRYAKQAVLDAYLLLGGIPEYLKRIKGKASVYASICQESFIPGAFFLGEHDRIFISSLSGNPNYSKVVDYLAQRRFATRQDITSKLKLASGGNVSRVLDDLRQCGFINHYSPYGLGSSSLLSRYEISDPYLQLYFRFIAPQATAIARGDFKDDALRAIPLAALEQWLGYSFERFCRSETAGIARRLGFGSVRFAAGPFFNRKTQAEDPGYQLDLVYDRADNVLTVCEVKYTRSPVSRQEADAFLAKTGALGKKSKRTIERVLISVNGASEQVRNGRYFDRILGLEDLI